MKKFLFLTAMAAMTMLLSCNHVKSVYEDGPYPIEFSTAVSPHTKVPLEGSSFLDTDSFMVSSYLVFLSDQSQNRPFFQNIIFKKQPGDSYWTGDQYWPMVQCLVNFSAIALLEGCEKVDITWGDPAVSSANIVIKENNTYDQYDLVVGGGKAIGNINGFSVVCLHLKHTLSWVQVSFKSNIAEKIIIKSVYLTTAYNGRVQVSFDYTNSSTMHSNGSYAQASWSPDAVETMALPNNDYTAPYGDLLVGVEPSMYGPGLMVLPSKDDDNRKIEINYAVQSIDSEGKTVEYDYATEYEISDDWVAGNKYEYLFDFNLKSVKCSVERQGWYTNSVSSHTYQ